MPRSLHLGAGCVAADIGSGWHRIAASAPAVRAQHVLIVGPLGHCMLGSPFRPKCAVAHERPFPTNAIPTTAISH